MSQPLTRRPATTEAPRIAVVVPCYRVSAHILPLLARVGEEVNAIYVIDDACPEKSGSLVERECRDDRVKVLYHDQNQGVGGALVTGYQYALQQGAEVVVKLDGDGQMDPALIPILVQPILDGEADYTKGNRFFEIENLRGMPLSRLIGNAALSFLTKLSSGYYTIFDPNNGYTAIHGKVLARLRLDKIHRRYFFESDMLFQLGKLRAVVLDVPMRAHYGDETSSLSVTKSLFTFSAGHFRNAHKRIFYSYFLRDFNPASIHLLSGIMMLAFGITYGAYHWWQSYQTGITANTGDIMIAALPVILGVQFLLSFFTFDSQNSPTRTLHPRLEAPASQAWSKENEEAAAEERRRASA